MGGGLTNLYHCRHKMFVVFCLYRVLFSTKPEHSAEQLLAADPSYCWMRDPLPYPSKQAVDHFMFFMRLYHVLFSHLECSVEQVLTADLSASTVCAGRLLIATSTVKCSFFSNSETWSFGLCSLASSSALNMLLALFHSRRVSWLPNWCVGRYVCPVALNCRKCCICCECTCMTSQVMKHATCTLLVWDGFDTCRFLA